ncbi:MAG: rhodanese-like domain-containing protein [Alistipes sp.]|nr:rhodanese-like domain-containing protein [Alistipes sp.]
MKKQRFCLLCALVGMLFGCSSKTEFRSVESEEFARIIAEKEVQLVDVRTPSEYAEGHISGAVNMDVQGESFAEQVETLDKERPVALYCRSGRRSKLAAEQVVKAGYEVVELNGGILSWQGETVR